MWRARARHREGDNGARERVVGAAHGARDGPWRAGGRRDVRGCVFPVFPSRTERNLAGRVTGRADARPPTRRPPFRPSAAVHARPTTASFVRIHATRARPRPRARPRVVVVTSRLDRARRTPPHPPSPLSSPFVSSSFVECRNPYDYHDPPCKHNTSLWTALSPHPANCAHCVANARFRRVPRGWRGVDCGVCASAAACPEKILPSGRRVKPVGCTSSCLVPTREETAEPSPFGAGWDDGKVFSCACGGDARTDPFCDYQKDTTFLFHMTADANGDGDGDGNGGSGSGSKEPPLRMRVKEYGGIPNMDREGVGDWKYRYAFAPVWDANFTGCEWQVTSCPDPLPSAETCAVYTCPAGRVACPPEDLPRCPGRNALGCGRGPKTARAATGNTRVTRWSPRRIRA